MIPAPVLVRRLDSLLDQRKVALPLFALLAFAFTSPLYLRPMNLGHGDWIWFHFIWESARKSFVELGETPWWNPYYCGGNLGVANPNTFSLSPLFLALLPLPTALAMKVFLTTLTFAGLWGMWQLCRERYGRGLWAAVGAMVFSLSGYFGWHMNGQTGMANLHLLPWAVLFFLRGTTRPAWSLAAGLVLAFMILDAGLYPCVITCVTLASVGLVTLLDDDWVATGKVVRSGLIAAASAGLYAAVKLVPMIDFLRDHRRPIPKDDAIGLPVLIDALFVRRTTETQIWPHEGYIYAWWGEYSNYLGPAGVAIAVAAIWAARKRLRREMRLALFALALLIGDHGSYSPYAVLRSLPMLGNLRVPTRYWVVVDLWVGCAIAWAGFHLSRRAATRLSGPWRALSLGAMLGLAAYLGVDLVRSNGIAIFKGAMPTPPAPAAVRGAAFHQVQGGAWEMYRHVPKNEGSLRCFDELTLEISPALKAGLPSEAYLLEPDAGQVSVSRWKPSTWQLSVDVARPATVIVNQNAYRGWRAEGGVVRSHEGLVAVDVPAGKHPVTVYYRPPGYLLGIGLTLASLAATAALVWRERRSAAA